jgi:transketolase
MIQGKVEKLEEKALWVRQQILRMACAAGAGHIAPSFSCTELLVALYQGGILKVDHKNPKWLQRDRFILSKGQAALALYAVLADMGFFPVEELYTFTMDGSRLGGHADNVLPGVEVHTGSLGHGLSIGCGLAFAAKMGRKQYLSIVLLGDGECHEGSVWESAMFAGHHRLNNLIAIVDHNGLSASDYLDNYLSLKPFDKKWNSFGWDVIKMNGHSIPKILKVFNRIRNRKKQKPLVIIANTVKGKGVSIIENNPDWHYRVPYGKERETACKELKLKRDG